MRIFYLLIFLPILLSSCVSDKPTKTEPLLKATREAPLGWVVFKLIDERNFELQNNGIRSENSNTYPGTYLLKNDTLNLTYSIQPEWAGCEQAVIVDKSLLFEGCLGSLRIGVNNIK